MILELLFSIFVVIPLFVIITILGILFALLPKRQWNKKNKRYLQRVNYMLDVLANTIGMYFLNAILIKKDSPYKFGEYKEPISSVMGKNKRIGNYTKFGILIDKILGKNHTIKSIEENI